MELHETLDYRAYLRHRLEANRHVRGYRQRLAEAAGCQLSYLSQALHEHVELTPDHAAGLCEFWKLDAEETAYYMALVHLSRAATRRLKRLLERDIAHFQKKRTQISERIGPVDALAENHRARYYAAWYYSAVHVLLLIPEFRSEAAIASRLKLERASVTRVLRELEEMGLAERKAGAWQPTKADLHLPYDSVLAPLQHACWRQRVGVQLQENRLAGLHYTGVHALSRADVEKVRALLLESIERARETIRPSPEETLGCLILDWVEI